MVIKLYTRKTAIKYYLGKLHTVLIKAYRATDETIKALQKELKPLQPMAETRHTISRETSNNACKHQEKSFKLSDFGIREFNQNDDWLFMKPGKRE
jgi:hypothetical protein